MSHEADDAEDDEAGEEAGEAVAARHENGVPEGGNTESLDTDVTLAA